MKHACERQTGHHRKQRPDLYIHANTHTHTHAPRPERSKADWTSPLSSGHLENLTSLSVREFNALEN